RLKDDWSDLSQTVRHEAGFRPRSQILANRFWFAAAAAFRRLRQFTDRPPGLPSCCMTWSTLGSYAVRRLLPCSRTAAIVESKRDCAWVLAMPNQFRMRIP